MQIEIKIEDGCDEPKVLILAGSMTEEVQALIRRISEPAAVLTGFREEIAFPLDPNSVLRIFSACQKVYAAADSGEYTLRLRLYEIEERLGSLGFVRISNSEIINVKRIHSLDLSFTGTICVQFQDGSASYVSRRYVTKIKQLLGL